MLRTPSSAIQRGVRFSCVASTSLVRTSVQSANHHKSSRASGSQPNQGRILRWPTSESRRWLSRCPSRSPSLMGLQLPTIRLHMGSHRAQGSRQYDTEFLDYTVQVLRKIKQYGFRCHSWTHIKISSRASPAALVRRIGTLIACGMNPRNVTTTQAAFIQAEWPNAQDPDPATFPICSGQQTIPVCRCFLSVLFFAGRHFAPRCIIDGQNIQDWLQSHFLNACKQLLHRIVDAVIWSKSASSDGIASTNQSDLHQSRKHLQHSQIMAAQKGSRATPIQSFRLGAGQAQTVENGSLAPWVPNAVDQSTSTQKAHSLADRARRKRPRRFQVGMET